MARTGNPLKRFPSKTSRLAPYFRSLDTQGTLSDNSREIEKRERWLQMDRLDPSFGVTLAAAEPGAMSSEEVFIRRTFRRMESSGLFHPPRMGASLAELSDPPAPLNRRFILIDETRLRELAEIEAILREEKEALGEQCSWIMSDYHIDARIPVPATRVAVNNLCEADMRRLAREFDVLQAAWASYARQNHYNREILPQKSYVGNAPLALRPVKLVALETERVARQLKLERDCMLFEDDRSFLINSYQRASARKKDYERYFILATRYGHMDEVEFGKDERPGRRYWIRALDGCLKFQKVWGAYWAVQSLRRYKGAKQFQKIVRGYLAFKKFHPLIIFRLKYGKSSYLKLTLHKWRSYVHLIKWCRESIAFLLVNWADKCLEHWKKYTAASKERKLQDAKRLLAQSQNAGLVRCFRAWTWLAQRQIYIKQRARRLMGACGPQFELWTEYVEQSKHLRKMFKTTSLLQSVVRMFIHRKRFKAKRKVGFLLGLIMRSRYIAEMRRNAIVGIDFAEWKAATEERRAGAALDAERIRLHNLQNAVVEREKMVRAEMRKHLRSRAGKIQLKEAATSILQSVAHQVELEEKRLYACCLELGKRFAQRDYLVEHPPLFKCVDPTCATTFTSEEQYHLHFKQAPKHRPKRLQSNKDPDVQLGGSEYGQIAIGSRKRVTVDMKLMDREREIEAKYAPKRTFYNKTSVEQKERIAEIEVITSAKSTEIEQLEKEHRSFKLEYVKESKSVKTKIKVLEQGSALNKQAQISELKTKDESSTKNYQSTKVAHTATVGSLQKEIEKLQKELVRRKEELEELEEEFSDDTKEYETAMGLVRTDREAAERKKREDAEAARKKREAEEADFHATLSLSTLHCLLLHPTEFLVLRRYLLGLLPGDAVVKPPGPTAEEKLRAEQEEVAALAAAKLALEEHERAEAAESASAVKVKGWTFVKGKGWMRSKAPPSKSQQLAAKAAAAAAAAAARAAAKTKSSSDAATQEEERVRRGRQNPAALLAAKTPAEPSGEPRRVNTLPEVHLLNCLDLWKAVQLWKDQVSSKDPTYTTRALYIFETFLLPETEEEAAAATSAVENGNSAGADGLMGTVVRSSGSRGTIGQRLSSSLRRVAGRIWSKLPFSRRARGDDSDSDIESDLESDSSDDEDALETKRKRRFQREEEAKRAIIVKRTVNLSMIVDKTFTTQAAEALVEALSTILSRYKGQKKVPVSFTHQSKQSLSWWRRLLRVKAKTFDSWTHAFVVSPNIFDDLHWALFKYLFEKVHHESGFEKSSDFVQYRLLVANDEAEHERLLFNDAKLARMDRIRSWARADFAPVHRAQYRLASQSATAALERIVDALVERASSVCAHEYVWQSSVEEQATHETTSMVAGEACDWVMHRLSDEWFDANVETYVKSLLSMGGEVRNRLMEFAGFREKDLAGSLKLKKAYSVHEVKSSASLMDSFLSGSAVVDEPPPPANAGEASGEEKSGSGNSGDGGTAQLEMASDEEKKDEETNKKPLSAAQKALLEMEKMGIVADKSLLPVAGASFGNKTKSKSKTDRAEAASRIQRRARGMLGRRKARAVFVKVWFKRFDNTANAPYYVNIKTDRSQWVPPGIYKRLFPWLKKTW